MDLWELLFILIMGAAIGGLGTFASDKIKKYSVKHGDKGAFRPITDSFNSSVEPDEKDIRLIYKKKAQTVYYSYPTFLEDYLLYLRTGNSTKLNDYNKANELIKNIIAQERTKRPYYGINENIRRNMICIEDTVQKESLKRVAKNNLEEIAGYVRDIEDRLETAKKVNYWTVPISILGLIFTVLAFIYGTKISKRDFKELDKHISTILDQKLTSTSSEEGNTINIQEFVGE